jgi:hypothetical protein
VTGSAAGGASFVPKLLYSSTYLTKELWIIGMLHDSYHPVGLDGQSRGPGFPRMVALSTQFAQLAHG